MDYKEEKYTTLINGIAYDFEVWMLNNTWRANAFYNNRDKYFTYAMGPTPEKAALNLVKKIESNGK